MNEPTSTRRDSASDPAEAQTPPRVRKAHPLHLDADATASEALVAVVRECVEHWSANADGVLEWRDPEALHQLRVGVRRLRSAFSLFSQVLQGDSEMPWLSNEIRDLTAPLGTARDLDVLLGGDLAPRLSEEVRTRLGADREAAYDVVVELLRSTAWRDVWRHVERFLSHAPWGLDPDPPARDVASEALERRWGRIQKRGARLLELSAKDQHRVRIEAKKLRYGCQFFASLYAAEPAGVAPAGGRAGAGGGAGPGGGTASTDVGGAVTPPLVMADALADLQDALGEVNDAVVAHKRFAALGLELPPVDQPALLDAAVSAFEKVAAMRPFWR